MRCATGAGQQPLMVLEWQDRMNIPPVCLKTVGQLINNEHYNENSDDSNVWRVPFGWLPNWVDKLVVHCH